MRFNKLSIGAALFAGAAVLALSAGAQADEWDHHHDRYDHRYDRERSYHEHYGHEHYGHEHYVHERPVFIHERGPVIVERERPVYVAPPVVYPMAPQGPSGLNLNFNIPLQ
jgi:hypothetical protein